MNKQATIYTIYDTKAEIYNSPFYANNNNHAIRLVSDAINDANNEFAKHPDDYIVYRIGTFDCDNGQLTADDVTFVVAAKDLVRDH